MASLQDIQKSLRNARSSVIAIGNFDGVHLGHQAIIQKVLNVAQKTDATPVVLILFPHPREIFTGSSPALLTNLERRKTLIQKIDIEHVYDLTFDFELSNFTAESILTFFQKNFHMSHMVIGATTHIGKNREGTPKRILEIAHQHDFSVTMMDQLQVRENKVSSSAIRDLISKGNVKNAGEMLGRFYSSKGIVDTGMGKGRVIGFPTANLAHIETMVPVRGVYAGYASVEGSNYKAAINVGFRPTITDSPTLVVEPHLLDFSGSIVGKSLEIQWVDRLRDEIKFQSIEELKKQIKADIRKTKDIL